MANKTIKYRYRAEVSMEKLERLAILLEELGEAQQIIGKILRHGYESYHPDCPSLPNRCLLEKELGDVLNAMEILYESGDLKLSNIVKRREEKRHNIKKWLHHQG